ncbi:ras/Rap GTPase-activating protein SynGAP isoform X2 [Dunckerocampus dactyliophorus]|uniref:ras/Rap GTPase-activating protein SynGAP isoform X2 n=1 Tax=Dunckerocampus dactyliophorus TaxID=161453 RepID=UPI00240633A0|nr:ras/Rap GTPase-activating protein SynGAP isoform X2 [Dunckerocampus dactyliophorus]
MGSEEKTVEPAEEPSQKGQGSPEKETSSSADHLEGQASQSTVPLNTYKWQTGSKGSLHEVVEDGTTEKIQKGNKWSKMQTWRKALSEDPEDKTTKMNSMPPTEAGWDTSTDPQQEGGGARLKKYWRSVSQKLKRPKLLSRNSAPFLRPGLDEGEHEVEHHKQQWVPPQEVPLWNISNCVLEDGQILISPEEEPTMWTRTRVSSCLSSLSMQNLVDMETECSPDNLGPRPKKEDGGVKALIKRRLESKAKRNSNTQVNPMGLHKGSRQYGSRESVSIPVCPVGSLDLSADASTVVRPVHSSILGEKYCFEVINSESTHCFGCSSAAERDRWIEDLRRAAQPNKDNTERTENSLSLWVNEAKDLPPKRRYYCEIHLDGTLFARSTSKVSSHSHLAGDSSSGSSGHLGGNGGGTGGFQLFWGEFFELDNLPCISQITLHLFCEEDSKKKRHSGEVFSPHLLGSVDIRLAEIRGRTYQEKWYPIIPYKVSATACSKELLGPQASLRIKARFQNLQVLPMEKYKEFAEYVTVDYEDMCKNLEPLLNVKEKEELAGALVHVLQSIGKAKEFLVDLAKAEVERLGEKEALIFRENSLATKAIDEYMKLVGQKYLIDTLGDVITRLYMTGDNCEVNPRKCHASELSNNQKHLREVCDEAVRKITDLHGHFPEELNKIFSSWTEMCEDQGRPEIGQRLIFASLFLRFLCPAVLSPSLFGLTQSYPESNTLRTLTLTAKVIQNLANFTLFGEKEEYMLFMNEFLQQHWDRMRGFLQTVSDPCTEIPMSSFDGYVDLPLQLAVLHGLLVDIIHQRAQETIEKLHPLPWILNQITESLGPEIPQITINSPRRQVKPMYIPPKHLSKYSPHQSSLQQLPQDSKGLINSVCEARRRKPVTRTQSAPYRRPEKRMKRHTSSEALPTADHEQDLDTSQPLISSPKASESSKPCAPVPWIKDIQKREPSEMKLEHEGLSLLDRHTQELSELRLGVDQVTERELEMAKRLEDFIIQSLDQHAMLQAEVNEIRNLLAVRDEQLASATFRLGVIEEERENDERKMNVATAAAERMNTLEEQFVDLMKDLHRVNEAYNSIVQAVEKQPV